MCRFIDAEKAWADHPDGYPVALLCRVLDLPRSTCYAWVASRPAAALRQAEEEDLVAEIREIHAASRGAYGAPRIHATLRRRGRRISRGKVEKAMRRRGIQGITRRRKRSLTRPDAKAAPTPDLIGRDFTANRPGTKLVGDITYLPTLEGWLYLATVLDLATR